MKRIKCLYFLDWEPLGWDMVIFSFSWFGPIMAFFHEILVYEIWKELLLPDLRFSIRFFYWFRNVKTQLLRLYSKCFMKKWLFHTALVNKLVRALKLPSKAHYSQILIMKYAILNIFFIRNLIMHIIYNFLI